MKQLTALVKLIALKYLQFFFSLKCQLINYKHFTFCTCVRRLRIKMSEIYFKKSFDTNEKSCFAEGSVSPPPADSSPVIEHFLK